MTWLVTIDATYESAADAKRVLDLLLANERVRVVPAGTVEPGWAAFVGGVLRPLAEVVDGDQLAAVATELGHRRAHGGHLHPLGPRLVVVVERDRVEQAAERRWQA